MPAAPTPDRAEQSTQPDTVPTIDLPAGARSAAPASKEPTPGPSSSSAETGSKRSDSRSLVGERIGEFELLAELGRGGMGIVYKARQTSLERTVAVKMLLAEHCHDPIVLGRFLTEAKTAAGLDHPNIVKIYQVGECPAGPYFVMEFIDGQTLEMLIQRGPLSIPAAMALLIAVADAVHYAHSKGVVHRDLKPPNVMLDPHRRPVVMDFGIAKLEGKSTSLTAQGAIMGTPAYMPPEQAGEEFGPVGPHSDVYSLGAILYGLLTGKPPYEGSTVLKTIMKVIGPKMPALPRTLRPDIPEHLEEICMKCLSKLPAERYPTARALADDLRRLRASQPKLKQGTSSQRASLPSLVLVEPSGKRIRITAPVTVLGRAAECDIVLRASDVSKRHCRLLLADDQARVEDLDSVNGISVNGEPVKRAMLHNGDRLEIAGYVFEVQLLKSKT